mgnify:CR=1 FL=1
MRNKNWKNICTACKLMWDMDRGLVVYSLIGSMVEAITPFIGIFLSAYVLDGLQTGQTFQKLLFVSLVSVSAIFLLTVLHSCFERLKNIHIDMCTKRYDTLMSIKTITMDYPLVDSPKVNDIRSRIRHDNDWGAGFYSFTFMFPWLISSFISTVIAAILLVPLFLNRTLLQDISAVFLLLAFAAVIGFNIWYSSAKRKEQYQLLDDPTLNNSLLGYCLWRQQNYHHGKDIRIFGVKPLMEQKLQWDNGIKQVWIKKLVQNGMKSGFSANFSAGLLQIFSYLFVVIRAAAGALTIGNVVQYAGIIYRFSQSISSAFSAIEEFSVAANRQLSTLEYLDLKDVLKKGTLPVEKRAFCDGGDNEYEIEFRNVSFRYPGSETYALRNVSIKFRIGERLAVVGMNGSGKTTFIKLLCRLYDPTEGEILLNGIDIRKYDYNEYLSIFSVVFQDFKLFSFSLGQNVAASVEVDKDCAVSCLKKAGFGDRLQNLPKGLDTCLYKDFEEDGVEISGGEAQKIALARALYKNAPFIILDEPTAALDPVAEYEVYSKFNEIVGDKTAVYISHRLSSCRFCDDIAVFDNGQIVQRGSHNQLLAEQNGKYHELWFAQAQYYAPETLDHNHR